MRRFDNIALVWFTLVLLNAAIAIINPNYWVEDGLFLTASIVLIAIWVIVGVKNKRGDFNEGA